jgi:hypothetical protein
MEHDGATSILYVVFAIILIILIIWLIWQVGKMFMKSSNGGGYGMGGSMWGGSNGWNWSGYKGGRGGYGKGGRHHGDQYRNSHKKRYMSWSH